MDQAIKYVELKQQRQKLSERIPLKMPFTLFIDPTNGCNFKCSFCPRNFADFSTYAGEFQHMGMDLFEKIMNDVKDFGGEKLKVLRLFYLGEPLLCPDFIHMLKLAIQYDIAERIEISSNASLLTGSVAKEILNLAELYRGQIYLRFSIYSVLEAKNQAITKSSITARQIYENIVRFQQLRNARHAMNVHTYAKMLNTFDAENQKFLTVYKEAVDEAEIEQPMNWSGYQERNLLADYNPEQIALIQRVNMPKVCAYPFHTLAIQSNGDAVCCCVDWSRQTLVGNAARQSLTEIWQGEPLKNLRILHLTGKRSLNEACKNCEKLPCGAAYELDNLDDVSSTILA